MEHLALQANTGLLIHEIDDDQLIAYSKQTPDGSDRVLTIVSLAPNEIRRGKLQLDLAGLGLDPARAVVVEDLIGGGVETWPAGKAAIEIDPAKLPARVLHVRQSA